MDPAFYQQVWDGLPDRLRDAFGRRDLTPEERATLASHGVPMAQAQWAGTPQEAASLEVSRGFLLWVADLLDTQADGDPDVRRRARRLRDEMAEDARRGAERLSRAKAPHHASG